MTNGDDGHDAKMCLFVSKKYHTFMLHLALNQNKNMGSPDGAEKVELIDCLKDCPDEKINPKCTASVYSDKMFTGNVPWPFWLKLIVFSKSNNKLRFARSIPARDAIRWSPLQIYAKRWLVHVWLYTSPASLSSSQQGDLQVR